MKSIRNDPLDYLVMRYSMIISSYGYLLTERSKILDLGCGSGAIVYAFRDRGFDAYGFDVYDYLQLREEKDKSFFSILIEGAENKADFKLDWDSFKLPYPDEYFDFAFSTEVFEHVQNHDCVVKELARVMKANSVSIHTFPSRWRLIEPHINIPLGGVIKSYAYYLFWTSLGIRNQKFKGRSAKYTARKFYDYAMSALNYIPPKSLKRIGKKYFTCSEFAPKLWTIPEKISPVPLPRSMQIWLYTHMWHVCWVLNKTTSEDPPKTS